MAVAGVLLCGGEGRRLGSDKSAIVLGNTTLAQRAEQKLRESTDVVVVADTQLSAGGPLVALIEAWRVASAGHELDAAVVLAVDMPFVPVAFLHWLAGRSGTVVPVVAGRDQPLCARYAADALHHASVVAAGPERSMRALLASTAVTRVTPDDWGDAAGVDDFFDVDTAVDLAAARRRDQRSAERKPS